MAEIVATTHTTIALYFNSIQIKDKGNRNNNTPVALFKSVCSTINLFVRTTPQITVTILIPPITTIQIHNHIGTSNSDKILIKRITTNIKSAKVSNLVQRRLLYVFF